MEEMRRKNFDMDRFLTIPKDEVSRLTTSGEPKLILGNIEQTTIRNSDQFNTQGFNKEFDSIILENTYMEGADSLIYLDNKKRKNKDYNIKNINLLLN